MRGMFLVVCTAAVMLMLHGIFASGSDAPAPGSGPVVVELYSSEGCSSCPPADELLTDLSRARAAKEAVVIPLEFHVDYWNRLGWTDPFSSAAYSRRQQDYAASFRTDAIYTPQMIVDGRRGFVGSDAGKARSEINAASQISKGKIETEAVVTGAKPGTPPGITVSVKLTDLPAGRNGPSEVIVAVTEDGLVSDVRRGENAGRVLHHTGVVRAWQPIGTLTADHAGFDGRVDLQLEASWKRQNLHVVTLVQEKQSRRVIAAATTVLPDH